MNTNDSPPPHAFGDEQQTIEASFAVLELCLEQLATIAPVENAAMIVDLVPSVSATAQRLILVELIKFDLASAAESGKSRGLEFYWPASSEILPQDAIPFDLVLEEVQLLRAAGAHPRWEDYKQRFPDLAETIGRLLAGGDTAGFSGATQPVPELPVGEVIDDFHILKQLGQGAFARVYLARQQSMQRLVALKATSRGSDEPKALSQLDHANVVRVYDQREIANPKTILLYMQYLAGGTLADCIKQVRDVPREQWSGKSLLRAIDGRLLDASQTVPEQSLVREQIAEMQWAEVVAWIGIQLAEGLGYAYEKNVLHRDVKPANILLSAEAVPKLADFNVSCSGLAGRAGAAAYFGGSLAYMSPEQLQVADPSDPKSADELDGRSDLYSLGIVLWELWQGQRPWAPPELAASWSAAVTGQRELRQSPIRAASPAQNATERVLEKIIRSLLAVSAEDRPRSGKETAARLRLAFYPELANRFEPEPRSLTGWLLSVPVLLISAVLIFGPNTAASLFNYAYNESRMIADFVPAASDSLADQQRAIEASSIMQYFYVLANWVNGIVFPLGLILFLIIVWPVARIVARGKSGVAATETDLATLWKIGYRATLICGVLWAVSGIVFAYFMSSRFPEFQGQDAFHFFISLVLCGGVAWIYPYFGMTLVSLLVYYPKVVAASMEDANFDLRCAVIRRHSSWYLLSAAAIPLTAVGGLVFREQLDRALVLAGVCVTGCGLLAAYFAHQKLELTMQQYAKVLGRPKGHRVV